MLFLFNRSYFFLKAAKRIHRTFFQGGNVLCLNLWSGSPHCGPNIHSIHFVYAFGAFMAPLAAAPFLSTKTIAYHYSDEPDDTFRSGVVPNNGKTWLKRASFAG